MNKQLVNQRTKMILVSIHRGFLTEAVAEELTDQEILSMVAPNTRSLSKGIQKLTPFTEKWVRKQVKANINITSLEILKAMGFETDEEVINSN